MHAQSLSHVWLFCDLMGWSPPGFSVHGISQARILKWVAISSSRGSSWPRDQTCVSCVSCISRQVLFHWATREPFHGLVKRTHCFIVLNHLFKGKLPSMEPPVGRGLGYYLDQCLSYTGGSSPTPGRIYPDSTWPSFAFGNNSRTFPGSISQSATSGRVIAMPQILMWETWWVLGRGFLGCFGIWETWGLKAPARPASTAPVKEKLMWACGSGPKAGSWDLRAHACMLWYSVSKPRDLSMHGLHPSTGASVGALLEVESLLFDCVDVKLNLFIQLICFLKK